MIPERRVKLARQGLVQTLSIPPEFELPSDDVVLRQEGGRLVIEPAKKMTLLELLATLEPIDEEFPEIEDLPPDPVDL